MATTGTLKRNTGATPSQNVEKETLTLTLRHIGPAKKSQFTGRWQRFVIGSDAEGNEYILNAEGQLARHVSELSRGATVTVSAVRGKQTEREYNGNTTVQTKLNRVYLADSE